MPCALFQTEKVCGVGLSPPSIAVNLSICGGESQQRDVRGARCLLLLSEFRFRSKLASSSSLRFTVVNVTDLVSSDGNDSLREASAIYSVPEDRPLSLRLATSSTRIPLLGGSPRYVACSAVAHIYRLHRTVRVRNRRVYGCAIPADILHLEGGYAGPAQCCKSGRLSARTHGKESSSEACTSYSVPAVSPDNLFAGGFRCHLSSSDRRSNRPLLES